MVGSSAKDDSCLLYTSICLSISAGGCACPVPVRARVCGWVSVCYIMYVQRLTKSVLRSMGVIQLTT